MSDYEDIERPGVTRKKKNRELIITTIILLCLVLLMLIIIILVLVWWPEPVKPNCGRYAQAAVATDSPECSKLGKEILQRNGSATDAAIASTFCVGVRNLQGCGVGGGSFFIVFDTPKSGDKKTMNTYNFRETAPLRSSKYMYSNGSSSVEGGMAIAVPGEIKGLYEVWKSYGKLPWRDLVEPTIKLCRDGFNMGIALARQVQSREEYIRNNEGLREFLLNEDGSIKKIGETIKIPKLADTLEKIAENPEEFYSGRLARAIVDDVAEAGGILTLKDLLDYKVVVKPAYTSTIPKTNITIHTMPPPASGPILTFMLNLLDGFNLTKDDLGDVSKSGLTYHRIVESFRFGYAMKTYMGDEDFNDLTEVLGNISSPSFIDWVRSRITPDTTHPTSYYNPQVGETNIEDGGTCHLSVLAPDGGAVSATSTINLGLGSGVVGRRTGILFNNEMDDFTIPSATNSNPYGRENFIEPGKRPLSSMAPSLVFKGRDKFWMTIGGSGGTEITTAMLYTMAHYIWLGHSLEDAVGKARLHDQLLANVLKFEKEFNEEVLETLKQRGHKTEVIPLPKIKSTIQAVARECDNGSLGKKCIVAVSDSRRGGKPDGY